MSASVPGLGGRREAREEALSFLYQTEVTGDAVAEALAAREIPLEAYAVEIIEGVDATRVDLDEVIGRNLTRWSIHRMPVIDRVIARVATWELQSRADVPTAAVLSEAVELATQYCGEDSPRFLNGVLRSVANELRPDEE
ncbi:MAG: transcription antitermination factor NusB [Acidimicrobiales bacterium]